jgi:hypothetical protein
MKQYSGAASCQENPAKAYPRCGETSHARTNDGDAHRVKLRVDHTRLFVCT